MFMLCYEECKQKFMLCRAYIEGHQLLGLSWVLESANTQDMYCKFYVL